MVIDVRKPVLKHAESDTDIDRCFPVMAELRTHLRRDSFVDLVQHLAAQGYRLAYLDDGEDVVAVAGYRIYTNLFLGKNLYVDDLVTSERVRSQGYGKSLMSELREIARKNDCEYFHLDSGIQRDQAHKFYFREGMTVSSFHFSEKLK